MVVRAARPEQGPTPAAQAMSGELLLCAHLQLCKEQGCLQRSDRVAGTTSAACKPQARLPCPAPAADDGASSSASTASLSSLGPLDAAGMEADSGSPGSAASAREGLGVPGLHVGPFVIDRVVPGESIGQVRGLGRPAAGAACQLRKLQMDAHKLD